MCYNFWYSKDTAHTLLVFPPPVSELVCKWRLFTAKVSWKWFTETAPDHLRFTKHLQTRFLVTKVLAAVQAVCLILHTAMLVSPLRIRTELTLQWDPRVHWVQVNNSSNSFFPPNLLLKCYSQPVPAQNCSLLLEISSNSPFYLEFLIRQLQAAPHSVPYGCFCWVTHIHVTTEEKPFHSHTHGQWLLREVLPASADWMMCLKLQAGSTAGGFLSLLLLTGSVHRTEADRWFDEIFEFKRWAKANITTKRKGTIFIHFFHSSKSGIAVSLVPFAVLVRSFRGG